MSGGHCEFCPAVGDGAGCAVCRAFADNELALTHLVTGTAVGARRALLRAGYTHTPSVPTPRFHRAHLRLIARDGQLIEDEKA